MKLSRAKIKELNERFHNEVLSYESATSHRREIEGTELLGNGSWGGYSNMCGWPGSCGNQEWCGLGNDGLNDFSPEELAHWIKLIKKTFIEHKLGNLFYSFPCYVETGKPCAGYTKIAQATKLLKLKRWTRSVNPNHRNRFQDVYLLVKDNY